MTRAEMKRVLVELGGGTPSDMAEALAVDVRNGSLRRALKELEDEGTFVVRGTTSNRFYMLASVAEPDLNHAPPPDPVSVELIRFVMQDPHPTAHQFSDFGHSLGLYGKDLGKLKLKLGIETYREPSGLWRCRKVEGVSFHEGALTREQARRRGEQIGTTGATLAQAKATGGSIGGSGSSARR